MKLISLSGIIPSISNLATIGDQIVTRTRRLGDMALDDLPSVKMGLFMLSLAELTGTANWLELPATAAACERCYQLVKAFRPDTRVLLSRAQGEQIGAAVHQIVTGFTDELDKHFAYVVAPPEVKLLESTIGNFDLEIVQAFPAIRADVHAAGQCRAFELWTACVMHLMRVSEIGVGALADHLEVKRGTSWGGTIANIAEALRDTSRIKGEPALRQWASETGTYLNFVKDAFRNPAMHPERSFQRDETIMLYENTRMFMRMLAQRIGPARAHH